MKLYANIRAQKRLQGLDGVVEKAQGSNDWIEVTLSLNREREYRIVYREEGLLVTGDGGTLLDTMATKGNKKKDEKHVHDWDNYGKCNDCGKWDTEGTRL